MFEKMEAELDKIANTDTHPTITERGWQEFAKAAPFKNKPRDITMKVSQKGAVSVYGLGRFPVTLYKEQWEKLLTKKDDILEFIEHNKADLKTKE